ncbi:MAG: bifunctional demethylmenaquinone methyltransferase/2-methoxy-6-polyprenyl-1,4-benzoquinol methylase UbiE [Planctomycetaceae bacterium]|jgi:demethylmenaquinone methyltransferase/2-methoxy-6-polyprenyl-1,4-benzoquinol methylase|nr:bifunctional demethylmenaquinone methyltransferase/2-methoxy-6-polyprenyl-1,4-benzoquinol methylase UbiE [Planctomycetaceae bacterium]
MMPDKSPQHIRGIFDTIAHRYDFLNHFLSFGLDRLWRRKTLRRLTLPADGEILDVCTGTADFAIAYAKRCPGCRVTGIDFSPEMLRLGKKRVEKTGANIKTRINLMEGDALNLPFAEDRFSLVSVSYGLRNTADAEKALSEMVRVCKPDGTVAIVEFSTPACGFFSRLYRLYFRWILPRLGAWISGEKLGAYQYLHDSVQEFSQGEKLAALMEQTGLKNIRQFPMTFGAVTLSFGEKG